MSIVEQSGWAVAACLGLASASVGIRAIAIGRRPRWLTRLRRTARHRLDGAALGLIGGGAALRGVTELVGVHIGFAAFLIMAAGFVVGLIAETWPPATDIGRDGPDGDDVGGPQQLPREWTPEV